MAAFFNAFSAGVQQEAQSFKAPPPREVATAPEIGAPAPSSAELTFPSGKTTLVVFLRHCGCPFAEKTFGDLVTISNKHPKVRCIAVSHSSREATDRWIVEIGGQWDVEVIVDEERKLFAAWGLGTSNTWHLLNPWSLASSISLARNEGIWTRATESGSRWQTSGAFAIDTQGVVRWRHVSRTADDMPPFAAALKALEAS